MWDGVHGCGRGSSNIPKSWFLKDLNFVFLKLSTGGRVMRVCDASRVMRVCDASKASRQSLKVFETLVSTTITLSLAWASTQFIHGMFRCFKRFNLPQLLENSPEVSRQDGAKYCESKDMHCTVMI